MAVFITKKYTTETAHIVRNAYTKRCKSSIHGHMYEWEITIGGNINDQDGMVLDFGNMQEIKALIDLFDHATVLWQQDREDVQQFFIDHFNRVLIMKQNCTAENMARLVFHYVDKILRATHPSCEVAMVTVHETRSGEATASSDDGDSMQFALVADKEDVVNKDILRFLPTLSCYEYAKQLGETR